MNIPTEPLDRGDIVAHQEAMPTQPQAPVKPKMISNGDLKMIHSLPPGELPHDFLAKKIEEVTGQPFDKTFAAKDKFQIHTGFKPQGDDRSYRDMYTYTRNNVEHFGVKRYVTVSWEENGHPQQVNLHFSLETGIKVPQRENFKSDQAFFDAMDQGMYMAGVAGKLGAKPWELMIQDKVGQAKGDQWTNVKERMDTIVKDRFVTVELISDAKSIKMNAKDTFNTRHITQVKVHIRGEKSSEKIIANEDALPTRPKSEFNYFQSQVYKTNKKGRDISYQDIYKRRDWRLSSDPMYTDAKQVSASTKTFAEAQWIQEIGKAPILQQALDDKALKPKDFASAIQSKNERLQKEFENTLYLLSDGSGIPDLVEQYSTKTPPNFRNDPFIQDNFETVEKTPSKIQQFFGITPKQDTPTSGRNLEKLKELSEEEDLTKPETEKLQAILDCSKAVMKKLTALHNEMVENDQLLKKVLDLKPEATEEEKKSVGAKEKGREEILKYCTNLLENVKIPEGTSVDISVNLPKSKEQVKKEIEKMINDKVDHNEITGFIIKNSYFEESHDLILSTKDEGFFKTPLINALLFAANGDDPIKKQLAEKYLNGLRIKGEKI